MLNPMNQKTSRLKVYLAGPDVFFPNARHVGLEKKRICAEHGFEGLFPLDNEIPNPHLGKSDTAKAIFEANCEAMDNAHFVIANMMPFRGVSTDAGTAFEIGYMYARGKPVFGYGSDFRTYLERVLNAGPGSKVAVPSDQQGMHIEDFDLVDNLMLVCAVRRYGHDIVRSEGKWNDLSAFTECVRLSERLSERDWAILHSVAVHHFLTVRHVEALHFADNAATSAGRIARRTLARLRGHRLLGTLKRHIGGMGAGSEGLVHYVDGQRPATIRRHRCRG